MRTTCKGNNDYCMINRTKLRPNGVGKQQQCPVCGKIYDEIERRTPEENQKIINQTSCGV